MFHAADIDECKLGVQDRGHNCPVNSTCNNTIGSFECNCFPGFNMAIDTSDIRRCEGVCVCVCVCEYEQRERVHVHVHVKHTQSYCSLSVTLYIVQ